MIHMKADSLTNGVDAFYLTPKECRIHKEADMFNRFFFSHEFPTEILMPETKTIKGARVPVPALPASR